MVAVVAERRRRRARRPCDGSGTRRRESGSTSSAAPDRGCRRRCPSRGAAARPPLRGAGEHGKRSRRARRRSRPAGEGADHELAVLDRHGVEPGHGLEVDEGPAHRRGRLAVDAVLEGAEQIGAPGQRARAGVAAKKTLSLAQRGRGPVADLIDAQTPGRATARPRSPSHPPAGSPALPALTTASTIPSKQPQRQMLPASAATTCSTCGCATRRSRALAARIMPGVQKPHWMALPWPGRDSVAKATISGSSAASPSTVKMSAPSAARPAPCRRARAVRP